MINKCLKYNPKNVNHVLKIDIEVMRFKLKIKSKNINKQINNETITMNGKFIYIIMM